MAAKETQLVRARGSFSRAPRVARWVEEASRGGGAGE